MLIVDREGPSVAINSSTVGRFLFFLKYFNFKKYLSVRYFDLSMVAACIAIQYIRSIKGRGPCDQDQKQMLAILQHKKFL